MRFTISLFLMLLVAGAANPPEPAIPYFSSVRDVHIAQPDQQSFFIVDEELWSHARPDLGDLRLYEGKSPVQYALSEQQAGVSSEEVAAKIVNLGSVSGHTEFDLDTQDLAEYACVSMRGTLWPRHRCLAAARLGRPPRSNLRRPHSMISARNSWARTRY